MTPTEDPGLRDQVARVIDPEAWEESFLPDGTSIDTEVAHIFADALEESKARADAILSLPAARKGQGEWRPIESAPRDGTWFIALQNGETYPCEWHATEPDEGPAHEGWWDHFNQSFEEPTHWMPLPPPSKQEE